MRICYITHSNAHFSRAYVDYFSERGHEVHVVSCHHEDMPGAINHHPAGPGFDVQTARFVYFWLQRPVRRIVQSIKPDLVHAHYLTSNGMMAVLAGHRPVVVSARGSDVHESMRSPLRRRLIAAVCRRADLVNVVSEELAQALRGIGVPSQKILQLPQGIHVERFALPRQEPAGGPIRLICTRKLHPVYEPHTVVRALAELHRRGIAFRMTFAASGSVERAVRDAVARARLQSCVNFLGGFTQDELPVLLAEHDVYLSASVWDGTSPALLEAMAAGIYPVVSDIPANRAWLQGDRDGGFFPVGDAQALADVLAAIAGDAEQRRAAVDVLRARVRAEGDRTRNMQRMEEAYDHLLNGPGGGQARSGSAERAG